MIKDRASSQDSIDANQTPCVHARLGSPVINAARDSGRNPAVSARFTVANARFLPTSGFLGDLLNQAFPVRAHFDPVPDTVGRSYEQTALCWCIDAGNTFGNI